MSNAMTETDDVEAVRQAIIDALEVSGPHGVLITGTVEAARAALDTLRSRGWSRNEWQAGTVATKNAALETIDNVTLPPDYKWGSDAKEAFSVGKLRAFSAVMRMPLPAPPPRETPSTEKE